MHICLQWVQSLKMNISVFFFSKLFHILAFILRLALLGDKERFSAAVQWLGKNLRFDKLEDSPRKFFFIFLVLGQQLDNDIMLDSLMFLMYSWRSCWHDEDLENKMLTELNGISLTVSFWLSSRVPFGLSLTSRVGCLWLVLRCVYGCILLVI